MRRQGILRDPPTSSVCAFCAHRLVTARPFRVQRRFLQSSKPASKPPDTASAVLEENIELNTHYSQFNSQLSGTPRSGFGRRPAFGSGTPPTPGSSRGWSKPAFSPGTIELTEEERGARDSINEHAEKQQQRRLVDVFPEPGPESSRAGRPIPMSRAVKTDTDQSQGVTEPEGRPRKSLNRLRIIKSVMKLDNLPEHEKIQTEESISSISRREPLNHLRVIKSVTNYANSYAFERQTGGFISSISHDSSHSGNQTGTWGQLRRREKNQKGTSNPDIGDRFTMGRAKREEESKSARYTPLVRAILSDPVTNPESSANELRHYQPPISRHRVPEKAFETRRGEVRDNVPISVSTDVAEISSDREFIAEQTMSQAKDSSLNGSPARVEWRTAEPGNIVSTMATSGTQSAEMETEQEARRRRRAEKYAAEDASKLDMVEDSPRGRRRDKTRRRQQFSDEYEDGQDSAAVKAELKRQRKREKAARKAAAPTPILLPEYISVANLAAALKVRVEDFVQRLGDLGFEETGYDHILNGENAGLVAMEYNFEPIIDRGMSEDLRAGDLPADSSDLLPRPPVVTIMGHVDHGKTTLLDWLRKSSVAATEYGGITQHIGAFSVAMPSGKTITFLDTPGHAAFLSMRQRGANVTDIVILVVAADDSVKPQTIEAINHAKTAKVPIIVAVNKIDKEEADIERVKQDLARHGIDIEDFGGDTQVVCVSGKTGKGMEELEESIVTLSEILDMRAQQDGQAEGWVIEASIRSMGKIATVLVRRGTMRPGDFIVAGKTWARIRCLRNEAGVEVVEAGPGTPVEIDGWKELPVAGDEVLEAPTESKAKSVVEFRLEREERDKMAEDMIAINEARKIEQEKREHEKLEAEATAAGREAAPSPSDTFIEDDHGPKRIQFIVKGDVSGSVEAVVDSVSSIGNAEVQPHVLRSGVGQLSAFDVEHAAAANGCLINFNTPVDTNIVRLAHEAKVQIIDHNIIYRLVDEVKAKLSEYLPPLVTQRVLGEADVAQVFDITIKGRHHKSIAGCKIKNGTVSKNSKVRVLRHGVTIFDGTMGSLKNVKKDVMEVRKGSECGIGFEGWSAFQVGDQIQCYETKEEKRYL